MSRKVDRPTASTLVDGAGDGETAFLFVGVSLALDLVNTEVVARGKPRDLLQSADGLKAWWHAARAIHPSAGLASLERMGASDMSALLTTTRELRGSLRALCEASVSGLPIAPTDLEHLNRILRVGYETAAVDDSGRPRAVLTTDDGGPHGLLLPVSRSALELLTGNDLARLHRCANERCVLLFYDATRSATRRWCSVGCMNRARSSRRYRERKTAAAEG